MSNSIKTDLLLTALAQGVQNTEALSDTWPRQQELLALLSPHNRSMIDSFYSNGYFVAEGLDWEAYGLLMLSEFGFSVDGDWDDFYSPNGLLRKQIDVIEPTDLIAEAFAFIDAFEG